MLIHKSKNKIKINSKIILKNKALKLQVKILKIKQKFSIIFKSSYLYQTQCCFTLNNH